MVMKGERVELECEVSEEGANVKWLVVLLLYSQITCVLGVTLSYYMLQLYIYLGWIFYFSRVTTVCLGSGTVYAQKALG